MMINYEIIASGSKGNAVVINNEILIDCGVPFKALGDVFNGLKLVLLSHGHQDHFNRRTIKKLAKERPTLRFGCCDWLVENVVECGVDKRNIDIYTPGCYSIYSDICTVEAQETTHNVRNCAYRIITSDGAKIFYATDLNTVDGIEAMNYDLYFLEANYSEDEIYERIKQKQDSGEYCYEHDVVNNHLSLEKANDWLYRNMGPKSQYVLMHEHGS